MTDAEFEELVDRVVERLRDRELSYSGVFSSVELPPDVSRPRFNELCRNGLVSGAKKMGRVWVVGRKEWTEYRTRKEPSNRELSLDRRIAEAARRMSGRC